jgi:transposase
VPEGVAIACGRAQIMRTGWYRAVHVKSFDANRARALLGARLQPVGMMTRLSNHIRGVLKTFGMLPGSVRGRSFAELTVALVKKLGHDKFRGTRHLVVRAESRRNG